MSNVGGRTYEAPGIRRAAAGAVALLLTAAAFAGFIGYRRARSNIGPDLVRLAVDALDAGEPARAESLLTQAIEINGAVDEAYLRRGFARLLLLEVDAASRDFEEYLRRKPASAEGLVGRGQAALYRGDAGAARSAFDEAIERHREFAPAWAHRALTRYCARDFAGAVADASEAAGLDPGLAEAYYHRALAFEAMGQHADALTDLDRTIERAPGLATAWTMRGRLQLERAGDDAARRESAIADLRQAIRLDPERIEPRRLLGLALVRQERWVEAIAHLTEVIEADPLAIDAIEARAQAQFMARLYAEAARDWMAIVRAVPSRHPDLAPLIENAMLRAKVEAYRANR